MQSLITTTVTITNKLKEKTRIYDSNGNIMTYVCMIDMNYSSVQKVIL